MSTPDLNAILEDLAAGRIDAAEAGARIDAIKAGQATAEPTPVEPTNEELRETEGWTSGSGTQRPPVDEVPQASRRVKPGIDVERITVHAVGRRVRVVGDYSVATVAAEGPHVLRRHGAVLEVSSDGEIGPSLDGFSMLRPPRSLDDIRTMGLGKELLLRVNPGLPVDIEVTAGSLTTERVPYLGKVRVSAGSANLSGVAEASDVLVQAGSADLQGCFKTGRSRARCESGALHVRIDEDSSVTIKAEAQLGKVMWSPGTGNVDEYVLGDGAARLDLSAVMGLVNVKIGEDA